MRIALSMAGHRRLTQLKLKDIGLIPREARVECHWMQHKEKGRREPHPSKRQDHREREMGSEYKEEVPCRILYDGPQHRRKFVTPLL